MAGGLGIVLGWAFVARARRVREPVLRLSLLSERRVAMLTATTSFYAASFFGLLFSFVLFLTNVWGLSTVAAGLGIVPMAATVVLLASWVGRLPGQLGYRLPLAVGAALMALGLVINASVETGRSFHPVWIPVVILIGIGLALCYLLLGAAAVATTHHADLAAVTAINQCARQLGAALGVVSAVAAIASNAHDAAHFHTAWLVSAGFAAVAAVSALGLGRDRPPRLAARS